MKGLSLGTYNWLKLYSLSVTSGVVLVCYEFQALRSIIRICWEVDVLYI